MDYQTHFDNTFDSTDKKRKKGDGDKKRKKKKAEEGIHTLHSLS
jgi:hypothetical protein